MDSDRSAQVAERELPMTTEELRAYARSFPSQGGVEIGPWLEKYASEVAPGSAIVEVGCWLGAGTAFLALGAMRSRAIVHTFDRWSATEEEVEKAAKFGVALKPFADTLPIVRAMLEKIPAAIYFHQGRIRETTWPDCPIGLYVDDATKVAPLWEHAMRVFRPHFIPGKTILVLMDYFFFESMRKQGRENWERYRAQADYMQAHAAEFQMLESRIGGTTAAVFRYLG